MFRHDQRLAEETETVAPARRPTAGKVTLTQGLVAQLRADEEATQGRVHPLAGSFVEDVAPPSSGGQPLTSSVLAQMEGSFGARFDGVRVHEGNDAPRAGAQAFTMGEDIYFAPGRYDPHSRGGQELIGHELAHVVQQREGRVAATGQAKGLALNDDSALEREADEQGARAAAGELARPGAALAAASSSPALAQRKVIQRRVGFEFETTGGWWFEGQRADGGWENIVHTKNILLDTPNGQGGISADNGHVEFVTRPLTTLVDVQNTVGEMLGLRDRFAGQTIQLAGAERGHALAQEANRHQEVRVTGAAGAVTTRPQATGGFALTDIPRLFEAVSRLATNAGNQAARNQIINGAERRVARQLTGGGIPLNMDYARGQARTAYDQAAAALGLLPAPVHPAPPRAPPPANDGEIVGLLALLLYTLYCAARDAGVPDMKYAFPVMPRTDFRSMVLGMNADSQAFLIELWNGGHGPLAAELEACLVNAGPPGGAGGALLDDDMFPGGYGADVGVNHGPTRGDFVSSMVTDHGRNAAAHKDELSPAPGYAQLEGFGQYGADNLNGKLNLLEFRGLAEYGMNQTIPSGQWLELAQAFWRLVDYVQNPPPPPAPPPPPGGPPPGGPPPGGPPPGGPPPGGPLGGAGPALGAALGGLPPPGGLPPAKKAKTGP